MMVCRHRYCNCAFSIVNSDMIIIGMVWLKEMMFRNWCVNNSIQVFQLTILNDIMTMNILGMLP